MYKYLYLTKKEWSEVWINGGEIPISLASTYLHDKREGILTPDENLIHESSVDIKNLYRFLDFGEGGGVRKLTVTNYVENGVRLPDVVGAKYYKEDGLILSFCNRLDESIAKRLGKECCVKVSNMDKLRKIIGKQLGVKGLMKSCEYTKSHERNHFLKSDQDEWQDEFRIFWKYPKNKSVMIPGGFGVLAEDYR